MLFSEKKNSLVKSVGFQGNTGLEEYGRFKAYCGRRQKGIA